MKTILLSLLCMISCIAYGQKQLHSTGIENKQMELANFHKIQVSNGIEVELVKGNEYTASITSNFMEYVRLDVKNGKLKIYYDFPNNTNAKNIDTKITIKAVNVNSFETSSGATLNVKSSFTDVYQKIETSSGSDMKYNVTCKKLTINSSSGSDVSGRIHVDDLEINASSGSDVLLSGRANSIEVNASSSTDVDLENLITNYAEIDASSSSDVVLTVVKEIDANASSSSDITYKIIGETSTRIRENISSGADISKIN